MEKSLLRGQRWDSVSVYALRRHCTKNRLCDGHHCMGSETLPEINVCDHSRLCHAKMQVKDPSCKEEATDSINMMMNHCLLLWSVAKWEVICGRRNQNLKIFLEIISYTLKRSGLVSLWAAWTSGQAPSMLKDISRCQNSVCSSESLIFMKGLFHRDI